MIRLTSVNGIDCGNESGGDGSWIVIILLRSIIQKAQLFDVDVQEHTYHGMALKGRGNRRMESGPTERMNGRKERKAT